MPSFDIASKVDLQTLDNAVNNVKKEIASRYDFKGTTADIELDKKAFLIKVAVESDMKLKQVEDIIISKVLKQGIDAGAFNFDQEAVPSGKLIRKEITVKNGLAQEDAKKIVKIVKESKLKVQTAIMDDIIRVSGKKIDDLQAVISLLRTSELSLPLQFINMKS